MPGVEFHESTGLPYDVNEPELGVDGAVFSVFVQWQALFFSPLVIGPEWQV